MKRSNILIIVLPLMLAIVLIGGATWAFSSRNANLVQTCVKDSGDLRVVNAADECKENEAAIEWNVVGLAGPRDP